mmetsp:Transcript_25737/g.43363  ORF Transcript_25737/g.43363 Transcript_25737/m.43363 type:complete len:217 (-) Transcript_25737:153-803(-)
MSISSQRSFSASGCSQHLTTWPTRKSSFEGSKSSPAGALGSSAFFSFAAFSFLAAFSFCLASCFSLIGGGAFFSGSPLVSSAPPLAAAFWSALGAKSVTANTVGVRGRENGSGTPSTSLKWRPHRHTDGKEGHSEATFGCCTASKTATSAREMLVLPANKKDCLSSAASRIDSRSDFLAVPSHKPFDRVSHWETSALSAFLYSPAAAAFSFIRVCG